MPNKFAVTQNMKIEQSPLLHLYHSSIVYNQSAIIYSAINVT